MERGELLRWLTEDRDEALRELWLRADAVRRDTVGDEVHLRGLIEISNRCVRQCWYCGIRAGNAALTRYRMTADEVIEGAQAAASLGYGTVVLQGGEDPGLTREWVSDVVARIKADLPLSVALSLGERSTRELATWRRAGADRYLLRFETSNAALFARIHPPGTDSAVRDRIGLLRELKDLGYEVGSGSMVGIPGQSIADIAEDILLYRELDLDMIGVGPFIPHPATPLGGALAVSGEGQAPATELMTYKVLALARVCCPRANIPSTSALATLNLREGRELGLMRGANVLMPNLTPFRYRVHYEIYPAKACIRETAQQCHACMQHRIRSIGRHIGHGAGSATQRSFGAGVPAPGRLPFAGSQHRHVPALKPGPPRRERSS
ncbi:MAG: [FeFe] hydrogenase H-cluster radical SAM maturase HydE [Thermoanaerobaculia bacterium]|nr:[FeFe] hydrogenase H-cluster radical SAM maturase HydE [Thermoanaerobaculia bacterium]